MRFVQAHEDTRLMSECAANRWTAPPPGSVEASVTAAEVDQRFGVAANLQRSHVPDDDRVIARVQRAMHGGLDIGDRLVEYRCAVGAKVIGAFYELRALEPCVVGEESGGALGVLPEDVDGKGAAGHDQLVHLG